MNKEEAIRFAGLMENYLNIPSFVCEMLENKLLEENYKEVIEYVIQRRNEIESKPDFISDRNAITMLVNQNETKDKEIERLNNVINELEKWLEDKIYTIEPKGTGINYNCEYDSEEDYINAMKEQSKLNTLKENLNKLKALKEGK